jgi:putative endonuclease
MKSGGWVYITTNAKKTVLYTGSTTQLDERIIKHQTKFYPNSFTARYKVYSLVYYRWFPTIREAEAEEARIKGGSRKKKEALINAMNPDWKDLWLLRRGDFL